LADLPEGARRIDPAAEAERLTREQLASAGCLVMLCDEHHLITASGMPRFVRITLMTEEAFPARDDLGKRIADLIREDLRRDEADD
jgi:hypothetical protein